MKQKYRVNSINVSVPLTSRQWTLLMDHERFHVHESTDSPDYIPDDEYVDNLMEAAGARAVEYNGHFGSVVFFTCANKQVANSIISELASVVGQP